MLQQIERSPGKGYTLLNLGSHWELHGPVGVFRGDLRQVCTFAVIEQGFLFNELETAVEVMEENLHDGAEFGVMKSFMFSFDVVDQKSLH